MIKPQESETLAYTRVLSRYGIVISGHGIILVDGGNVPKSRELGTLNVLLFESFNRVRYCFPQSSIPDFHR